MFPSNQVQKCFVVFGIAMALCGVAHGQPPGRQDRPRYVLLALDLNHDGKLSAEEIQAASATLKGLDRNGDGELTPDELEPLRTDAGASPDELVAQLMNFDKNGDGVLTKDEVPERMQAMFARGDKNKDGKLTKDEIRQMAIGTGSPNGRMGGNGSASGEMRLDAVLNALDADHDGIISSSEIKEASVSLLSLDADHDGTIEAKEMPVRQQTAAERVAHMMDEWDTNKDGKLSKDEMPDQMRAQFDQNDKNGDGFLSVEELTEMYSKMPAGRPGPQAFPQMNGQPNGQPGGQPGLFPGQPGQTNGQPKGPRY